MRFTSNKMLRSLIVLFVALHVASAFVIRDASPTAEDDNYTKYFVTLRGRDYTCLICLRKFLHYAFRVTS
ncbi:hypothetical protein B566_EDAN009604 [Ephemera danica]|nr:hypothetical protein B566_EDAN009604 [Ephemera danica]